MITEHIRQSMSTYVEGVAAPPSLVDAALVGGRRRLRRRRTVQAAGAGGAAVMVTGGALTLGGTGSGRRATVLAPATTLEASAAPTAAPPAAPLVIDGVTLGYFPAGWRAVGSPETTSDSALPCISETRQNWVLATQQGDDIIAAGPVLSVDVRRGPVQLPNPGGGPSFGPTDLGKVDVSPYRGPGGRTGTITAGTFELGHDLAVTVGGKDADADTIHRIVDGLQPGPAPTDRSVTVYSLPSPGPQVVSAHC